MPESLTVRAALEELSRIAEDLETIYYIYIVDDENHLRGAVSARQLVTHLGKPNMPITDLMERNLVTVEVTDDQESVAKKVADYDFLAIPVVDHEQHLVGIITHDDVIDVVREEATEDALRMAAVGPMVENYLEAAVHHDLAEAVGVAGLPVRGRAVHVHRAGLLRKRDRGRAGAEPVRAAVHFDRRQFRLASRHADHAGHGPGPRRAGASGGEC